jgi:signal transduction histidine kinase
MMKSSILRTLKRGGAQIFDHPQLWLTIAVAVAIVASFVYMADRFITIARDAQERLVNVRVGSLQDSFVPLAAAFIDKPDTLETYMRDIAARNPTIVEFMIVKEDAGHWTTTFSLNHRDIGNTLVGKDFVLSLAKADPTNSFTIEEVNGSERFFRTARAITDASGTMMGIVLTKQSLSEADRSIAASIQTSIIVLVAILVLLLFLFFHHARIVDYTALYRRLKEVDQLKDDFISMVSHEFRTPLTVIRGYIAELTEHESEQTPVAREMLGKINHSTENLTALVADMLDVARIEQGRMPLTLTALDTGPIAREVCASLQPTAEKKGLSLVCNVADGFRITADGERVRQVLTNLVSNAIKYSDKGEITVSALAGEKNLVLRVSDTGIGMSAEEVKQLFGKFSRATGERVRSEVGTGLGLWITKQLVEAMEGTISVESIKGVGSHFIVTFPLLAGQKGSAQGRA